MSDCSSCGKQFNCGMRETSEACWCAALPMLPIIEPGQDCLCPDCLQAQLKAQTNHAGAPVEHNAQ